MSRITLTNDRLTTTVVPEAGARIAQLADHTGRGWLVETDRPEPAYPPDVARADVRFTDGTRGGWDECVPSVAATSESADHGDFWFRPWQVTHRTDRSVGLRAVQFGPLYLSKTVTLHETRAELRVDVEVHNSGGDRLPVLYSAHPLFRWTSTARLEFPRAGEVRPAFGSVRHPVRHGAVVPRTGAPENYKAFVAWSGTARVSFADRTGGIVMRQPVGGARLRWLGVCVNRDSWPADAPGESWIALEPTTCATDSLDEAEASGQSVVLEPGSRRRWAVTVEIEGAA